MEDLERMKQKFEEIKNNDSITGNKKSIEMARLMTELEHTYNISIADKEEFNLLDTEVKKLYLDISNARNI